MVRNNKYFLNSVRTFASKGAYVIVGFLCSFVGRNGGVTKITAMNTLLIMKWQERRPLVPVDKMKLIAVIRRFKLVLILA